MTAITDQKKKKKDKRFFTLPALDKSLKFHTLWKMDIFLDCSKFLSRNPIKILKMIFAYTNLVMQQEYFKNWKL